ncbi:MAG: cytochrome P450, partial [Pseudomonadota bacterium]
MLDGTPHFIAPHIEPWQVRPKLHIWAREVRTNMLRAIPSDAYRRAVVSDRIGPVRWHFLGRPEAYEHVFRTALDNYPKAPIMHRMLGPYLGKGIFLAPPEDWHWQRRALAPAFGGGGLRRMAPAMLRVATDTADRLRSEGADGRAVKISFEMRVTAMEMVRHAMLDGLAEEAKELAGHDVPDVDGLHAYRAAAQPNLDRYLEDFGRPTLPDLLNLPNWLRPARFWRRAPTDGPREMLARLVAARRSAAKTGDDLLGLMLEARDPETGRTMTDAEIRDNLMTFIVTGSDTTALA